MHPRVEPVGVAQPRQVPPRVDVRFLDGVARELRVVEDQAGGSVEARNGPADELGEGVMIARAGPLDENPLVHGPTHVGPVTRPVSNRTVPPLPDWFPNGARSSTRPLSVERRCRPQAKNVSITPMPLTSTSRRSNGPSTSSRSAR